MVHARVAGAAWAKYVLGDCVKVTSLAALAGGGLVKPDDPAAKIKFLAAEALRGVGGLVFDALGNLFAYELGRRDNVTGETRKNKPPFRLALNVEVSDEIAWHCQRQKLRLPQAPGETLPEDVELRSTSIRQGQKKFCLYSMARVDGVLRGGAPPPDARGQCEQQRCAKPPVRTASVESQPPVLRPLEITKLWSCRRMYRASKLSQIIKTFLKCYCLKVQGMNFLSIHARDKVAGLD